MNARGLAAAFATALALGVASPAVATPVGDDYTLTGVNFPSSFGPVSITFGTGAAGGGLSVVESFVAGSGPNGGDVLIFNFALTGNVDAAAGFSLQIGDVDYADGSSLNVLLAVLTIDFGPTNFQSDVTGLLSQSFAGGLDLGLSIPTSWADIFAATNPGTNPATQLLVTLGIEVDAQRQVPEPGSLLLIALALIPAGLLGRRARRPA